MTKPRAADSGATRHGGSTVQSMVDITMSTKVKTTKHTKHTKLPPGIVPAGDGPGLYRVRYADGTLSDAMGLTEARDEKMNPSPLGPAGKKLA